LRYEEPIVKDEALWRGFRCSECGKRIIADFFAAWGFGERFTEELPKNAGS
jgi:hypothetical protein